MRAAIAVIACLPAAACAEAQERAATPVLPAVVAPAGTSARLDDPLMQGALVHGHAAPGARLALDGRPIAVAADGSFVFGLDRDAPATSRLTETRGETVAADILAVAPRQWNISRLPTLAKVPVPQREFDARRPTELARIAAARALVTDASGWRQHFAWPVTGRISTLFGSQRIYADGEAGSYHSGVDVARATGTVVRAPADGVVILAADSPFTLEGNLLMIDHGAGLNSAFLHLSRIDVRAGDHVRQGQLVGLVGMTGRATGPHLHWGMQWQGAKLDPLLAAGAMADAP